MKKARDELLSRYDGSQEPKFKKETTWRIWQKCVFMALHRNQTVQHAKILFKKFHGSWPEKTPELRGSVPAWEHNGDPIANHKSAMLTPPNGKDFDHGDEETTR
jgi:hypothetical protein